MFGEYRTRAERAAAFDAEEELAARLLDDLAAEQWTESEAS